MKFSTKLILKFFPLKERFWQHKIKQFPDDLYLPDQDIKLIKLPATATEFGAPSNQKYDTWKKNACGIIAFKTLSDHFGLTNHLSIFELIKTSLPFKTFTIENKTTIHGVFHQALLNFAKSLGFEGFIDPWCPAEKIIYYLQRNYFCLASLDHYQLWDQKAEHPGTGKHIILIIGFEKQNGKITKIFYKDSATARMWNKETDCVDFVQFKSAFHQRGIFLTHSKL